MLTKMLLGIALTGAEWVLWLLLILSVISIGIMIERLPVIRRSRSEPDKTYGGIRGLVEKGDLQAARKAVASGKGSDAMVLSAGLGVAHLGVAAVEEAMAAESARLKLFQERFISYLGTMGNNAPFIGLFGTVLGVIQAFHDLSLDATGGASVVMKGISEALIATAVGLFVAIPAVVAYNYLLRAVKKNITGAEIAGRYLTAALKADESLIEPAAR
ncbi:MAG: MotA/TolQ/ExbB proton channel family protein [Candidatus Latescibacterota bacterium]